MAVCATTGLPLAWQARTARAAELHAVAPLLDKLTATGFRPETCAMDKGYDYGPVHDACIHRRVTPVVARRKFANEKPHTALACEHGEWTFAGADFKRKATKWRCPTGQCEPRSRWVKADRRNPLIPRDSKRFGALYAGRAAVEREFGRLKHDHGLATLRVRGLARVQLHADLTMLARLSQALARARAVPLAA
jgi:Transposase DDE domain